MLKPTSPRTITLLEQKNGGRDTLPVNVKTLDVLKARAKARSLKTAKPSGLPAAREGIERHAGAQQPNREMD